MIFTGFECDVLQAAAGIDVGPEDVGGAVDSAQPEQFVDDHRARRRRGEPQSRHDGAHHPAGAHELIDEMETLRRDGGGGRPFQVFHM